MAKRVIRLITAVGAKINNDPDTKDYLRLYFLPDYNVSLAEVCCVTCVLYREVGDQGGCRGGGGVLCVSEGGRPGGAQRVRGYRGCSGPNFM